MKVFARPYSSLIGPAFCRSLAAAWLFFTGIVPMPGYANGQPVTYAYSWESVDTNLTNIVPFHWLRWEDFTDMDSAVKNALSTTRGMPNGHRVLFSWNVHNILAYHPSDYLKDKNGETLGCHQEDGQFIPYYGLWWEHGRQATAQRFHDFFRRYTQGGGELDVMVLDFEQLPGFWHLYYRMQQTGCDVSDYYKAVEQAPRFAELATQLGFQDLSTITKWDKNDQYLKWDGVIALRFAEDINEALYQPLRQYFPSVEMSNYGAYYQKSRLGLLDLNGHDHHRYYAGKHVGTHQSRELYGWLKNISQLKLDGKNRYGKTPFNAFRYAINKMRVMKLSSNVPVYPWISHKEFNESLLNESDLYQELIFHIGLTGVENFLYWNPRNVQPPASKKSDLLVSDSLLELDTFIQGSKHNDAIRKLVAWDDHYVMTGMRAGNRQIWRFTPALEPEQKLDSVLVNTQPARFKINNEVIEIPNSRVIQNKSVSRHGFWIVSETR